MDESMILVSPGRLRTRSLIMGREGYRTDLSTCLGAMSPGCAQAVIWPFRSSTRCVTRWRPPTTGKTGRDAQVPAHASATTGEHGGTWRGTAYRFGRAPRACSSIAFPWSNAATAGTLGMRTSPRGSRWRTAQGGGAFPARHDRTLRLQTWCYGLFRGTRNRKELYRGPGMRVFRQGSACGTTAIPWASLTLPSSCGRLKDSTRQCGEAELAPTGTSYWRFALPT